MSRVNVRVRPASCDDEAALIDLLRPFDPAVGGRPPHDTDPAVFTARLTAFLDGPGRSVLVATAEDGTVVGMLAARVDEIGALDLMPVMHVTHLAVQARQRRKGVGRALLAAAVHLADEAGVENVLGTAPAGSREGQPLPGPHRVRAVGHPPHRLHRGTAPLVGHVRRRRSHGRAAPRAARPHPAQCRRGRGCRPRRLTEVRRRSFCGVYDGATGCVAVGGEP